MRSTIIIAIICFLAPIAAVVAMYPQDVQRSLKDATAWAKKTFPTPKPRPRPVSR